MMGFFDGKKDGRGTLDISEIRNVDLNRWYFLN